MPGQLIDGKALAEKVRAQVAEDVAAFGEPVCLATILVGDDPASHIYVSKKHDASHEAGIDSRDHRFPSDTAESEVLEVIAELNADDDVDGILVQLPLPEHMDEPTVTRAVDWAKDVDGFHPENAGRLFLGEPHLVPATPLGVMRMLEEHEVPLRGSEAVVIGRSEIVGKPMAMLLLAEHATVTICHSRTVTSKTTPVVPTYSSPRSAGPGSSRRTWSSRARRSSTSASRARRTGSWATWTSRSSRSPGS